MPFKRISPEKNVSELTPLDISCTSTKCDDELHCFKLNKKLKEKYGKDGVCRDCGIDLVDWSRIKRTDLQDVNYTFTMLKKELIRHVYWHTGIKKSAVQEAYKMGKILLREQAEKTIRQKIARNLGIFDGRQTPKEGNIINYAQHATATCCRKCIEYWYKIPADSNYTEEQINFFIELIMLYIKDRVKGITDVGQ
ncbi:DUF4186 family protein [Maribellus maritimus]|uniref:DUF4186 family protein n=1 Tax=Maribellus maritimus TaxID=2870838 RepID=UPI001EEAFB27|nr:DUF4186 family protein [Maribellus maritimus]MCG6190200.1 DUF4186 domain-containing protein [Maribellus maritimus]